MVHLITLKGKVTELLTRESGTDRFDLKTPEDRLIGTFYVPSGTTEVLSLGDEMEMELHFEKAVTVVDSVDDMPEEALR